MGQEDKIFEILREKYGITTESQLNEAIRKQGFINLAPFCEIKKKGKENQHDRVGTAKSKQVQGRAQPA